MNGYGQWSVLLAGDAQVWVGLLFVPMCQNPKMLYAPLKSTYTGLQRDLKSFHFSFSDTGTIHLTVIKCFLE